MTLLDLAASVLIASILVYGVKEFFKDVWTHAKRLLKRLYRGFVKPKGSRRRKRPRRGSKGRRSKRRPWIYVYELPYRNAVKIGYSTVPYKRERQITRSLKDLGMPTGRFIAVFSAPMSEEQALHRRFSKYQEVMPPGVEGYTEWFKLEGPVKRWARSQAKKYPVKRV